MAGFRRMVDMTRTPEEKAEEAAEMVAASPEVPDVPYGLRICLTEEELEKLDLDCDCEIGDMVHLFAMAQVTSISKNEYAGKSSTRIELAITHLGLEDEDEEEEPGEE